MATSEGPPPVFPPRRRLVTIIVAFVVFGIALAIFAVPALRLGSNGPVEAQASGSASGYPSPPASGYWVIFPKDISPGDGSGVQVIAETNLPDGTVYQTGSAVFGTGPEVVSSSSYGCCETVSNGLIGLSAGNDTCSATVGGVGRSSGFSVTVTITPTVDDARTWMFDGSTSSHRFDQPDEVLSILGDRLQGLEGDQVQDLPDGSGKELVATAAYAWPEPQCGGQTLPLFGGPDCQRAQGQLQGDSLNDAMGEVMGAISQARMCEFWGTELPPAVEEAHPWDQFSSEWRAWYEGKDFTDSRSNADWTDPPFTWKVVGRNGTAYLVDITDHGQAIVELRVEPLPGYCPDCGANVVPFWGVTDWRFLA
jgi:hypothetical protein